MAPGPPMSLTKKLLFSAAVTTAFFLVLEAVLAVVGVEPSLYAEDPFVGFSSTTPLFVPTTAEDGTRWLETSPAKLRLFNKQRFPANKARGVTRIFCVGGSTTYGRPYDDATSFCGWLRALLEEAEPGAHEVINAGGISYASYRVALLMEELARYEPDLFIVYSGHNEFLEERTYRDLMDMPGALRGLGGVAAHTRVHALIRRVVSGISRPTDADGTTTVLSEDVVTRLDGSVGPDAYERNEDLRRSVLAHYRYNLARMVDIGRAAGAEVVLALPASNLADCAPFKGQHAAVCRPSPSPSGTGPCERRSTPWPTTSPKPPWPAAERAVAVDDRHAVSHFVRGRALLASGRFDEAPDGLRAGPRRGCLSPAVPR
jgi:hypothetical protein